VHPESLHALARERQVDLVRQHQFRHSGTCLFPENTDGAHAPLQRVRLSVGTVLVLAGARLLRGTATSIDIVDSRR
jgi:hypothetical protein